ncbi:MAG: aldehyde ferredoxin oxidoreductase [Deltaproteobacteria bacterium]|jgi:aldehyde:ferredoxin oxidoreductase|nr:aldehyde ferredoxin oxidoreductase [Deltaproteobacteria bacterium]
MQFIRVNMSNQTVTVEDVPAEYAGLGGRGLTSIMINNEVPPTCDPLGPENKLIFAPGLLSGTSLVNTSRISVGAKSPLTGTIKESNAGGTVAAALGKLGITAIIFEGQAPQGSWFNLIVDGSGNAKLEAADDYQGMRTYALVEKLLGVYGEKNGVLCIGPAGEYQLASASIQTSDVDGKPCRAAGRGGLGAVMGSKGLKAIVIDQKGKSPDAIADPDAFKESAKVFAKAVKDNPFSGQMLGALGTAGLVSAVNSLGAFPTQNATKGVFEGWEKVSGEALAEIIKKRGGQTTHLGCAQCIIHCSNVFVDEGGKYVTASLEYETIWSMGGMPAIDDLDIIARLDFLADDIGLDTINTGVAIGVAMDAGYKEFGDGQAAIEMMEEIAKGSEIGRVIGNGPVAVGKHFNHHRVPVAKGQSIAAYDPRGMQGNGVTYATSPMGADHTAGNLVGSYLGGVLNPLEAEGQVAASRESQIAMASLDCTGLCLLAGVALAAPEASEALLKMINAKLGSQLGADDIPALGVRVLKAEREFNRKAGFTNKDDRLAKFFYEEPLPPHNKVFVVTDDDLDSIFDF